MTDVPTAPRPAMPVAPEAPLPSRAAPPVDPYREMAATIKRNKRKTGKRKVGKHPALAAPYGKKKKAKRIPFRAQFTNQAPKNPNRPLELKTQLANVLALLPGMKKPEVEAFTAAMGQMQALSRSGRRRVLTALGQVYP